MKRSFLFLAILFVVLGVSAQEYQVMVWKNGVATYVVPTKDVDSITFVKRVIFNGALQGTFSVSATKKVKFSQGNLQYNANGKEWRFADSQFAVIGVANSNISATYDGWIDLFGWGTSGFDNTAKDPLAINYQPLATSTAPTDANASNVFGYGVSTNMVNKNLTGANANCDWGVYNVIQNGGDQNGMWRTLTIEEWHYLFYDRTDAANLFGMGSVNGVSGVILLPDGYSLANNPSFASAQFKGFAYYDGYYYSETGGHYSDNVFTTEQWTALQADGAVFLPAAGFRNGLAQSGIGTLGYYWSVSSYDARSAARLDFGDGYVNPTFYGRRCYGMSVRLVQDIK